MGGGTFDIQLRERVGAPPPRPGSAAAALVDSVSAVRHLAMVEEAMPQAPSRCVEAACASLQRLAQVENKLEQLLPQIELTSMRARMRASSVRARTNRSLMDAAAAAGDGAIHDKLQRSQSEEAARANQMRMLREGGIGALSMPTLPNDSLGADARSDRRPSRARDVLLARWLADQGDDGGIALLAAVAAAAARSLRASVATAAGERGLGDGRSLGGRCDAGAQAGDARCASVLGRHTPQRAGAAAVCSTPANGRARPARPFQALEAVGARWRRGPPRRTFWMR